MLGVSPNTVRRWCATGKLRSEQVPRPQGYAVRVYLDEVPSQVTSQVPPDEVLRQGPPTSHGQVPTDLLRAEAMATYTRSLLEPLVNRLAEQERTIRELAEELGRLRERVATFEAPTSHQAREASNLTAHAPDPSREPSGPRSPAPIEPTSDGQHAPWWRRALGWL
jgi:hypothetical protein